ncbi:MAG: hypothetical protein KDA72_11940 [Planctomycetales bacterium]|nr:hypothetical protein [Planctomycetales bacterium]
MGVEIESTQFTDADLENFRKRLQAEMELLRSWFAGNKFCDDQLQCGLELEAWLVDSAGLPVPDNTLFLSALDRRSVVPELSKFNFEFNVSPQYIAGSGLSDMQMELRGTWLRCEEVAQTLGHRIVSIGILPTVADHMLCPENMSPLKRYAAINQQVLRLRGGRPLLLEIDGVDSLRTSHNDVMLESAATSVQVHLKVPQADSIRYYNASLIASAITVALAANAPLFLGRRLWDDTRIAVFEQAVDTAGPLRRVSFGNRYLEQSLMELFEDNLRYHRVLLPALVDQAPARMPHVRMHGGTIWNWNRPLIGFEPGGQPHLRIEHRPMSASPSLIDLFADLQFYLGLVHYLARLPETPESQLAFAQASQNFYAAAKFGLTAEVVWLGGRKLPLAELLRDTLLPRVLGALSELGIPELQIQETGEVLRGRIETRQNGAAWQRQVFSACSNDLAQLLEVYHARQQTSQPVHTWSTQI